MRAVSCREGRLEVVELPTPVPGPGQLLIDVRRCGICGSDLHARHHGDELAELAREAGYDDFMRSDQDVVMGHEFCGEVVERGPRTAGRCQREPRWWRCRCCGREAGSTGSASPPTRPAPTPSRS